MTKIILFKIADYWFALPVAAVLKVVRFPPEFRTTLNQVGLARAGDRVICLLDLHQQFNVAATRSTPFLILVQLSQHHIGGIPVEKPPTLLDISPSAVQLLPPSDRPATPLALAKYVALVTSQEPPLEVFLLDLEKLARSQDRRAMASPTGRDAPAIGAGRREEK